jgi:hypothetical protein
MSKTLLVIRNRVRERLKDGHVRESALDPVHIDNAIADSYIELGAWLKAPYVYAANAGTIAAGAEDFDLPTTAVLVSTVEHGGDIRIQLASDGLYLQKMTREEIERLRAGNTSASGGGKPYAWAPYEDASTVVKCVCYPRSTAAEAYNLYRDLAPDDLRDAADIEAANIYFSRQGLAALVGYTAACLLDEMTDEDLSARRLGRGASKTWRESAMRTLYLEHDRQNQVAASGRLHRFGG